MAWAIGALVAGAAWWCGWYWLLVLAPVLVQRLRGPEMAIRTLVALSLSILMWLGLFALTQDRRFFFPFVMLNAVVFGLKWRGGFAAGAAMIVALFTMIRIEQDASFRVVSVELLVAIVASWTAWLCRRFGPVAAASAAELVAFAGLAL